MTVWDRGALEGRLAALDSQRLTVFALLCAERLYLSCWAFSRQHGAAITGYLRGCDELWRAVVTNVPLSEAQLAVLTGAIDPQVPRSDEFGDPLSVQAQSGMICLLLALDAHGAPSSDAVPMGAEAAENVVNALDNYDYAVRKALLGDTSAPTAYELLARELEWQQEVIGVLAAGIGANTLALRVRNRAFVVPPAV
jgi:hypothetical protein